MVDIETANPSKALGCLKELHELAYGFDGWKIDEIVQSSYIKQALLNAEKSLKALEIIKEKEVNMQVFNQCEDVETYNKVYIKQKDRQLTQEEFNLLKETLE